VIPEELQVDVTSSFDLESLDSDRPARYLDTYDFRGTEAAIPLNIY